MSAAPIHPVPELDELTRLVLELERAGSGRGRSKERAIREGLGISPTRYHQVLVGALERPEALAFDPMLVRRLRRLRDSRRRFRLARRLGLKERSGSPTLGLKERSDSLSVPDPPRGSGTGLGHPGVHG